MKKAKDYTLLALAIPFLTVVGFHLLLANDLQGKESKPVSVEYFKAGQMLLPDYACSDTLIVQDAAGLNKAMALIEHGIIDASDGTIDSTFHNYCTIK